MSQEQVMASIKLDVCTIDLSHLEVNGNLDEKL